MSDVQKMEVLGDSKINRFHLLIFFWCSTMMLFDGYDLVIYGSVLPHLIAEWKLPTTTAGILGSSALFGMMIGALFLGGLADRIGRKPVIIACLALFSAATFVNGFANNTVEFVICRFLTGLGIGGMSPNVVSLMTEMAPRSKRNVMVTVMLSSFSVGGVIAAIMGKYITPEYGWRANFLLAGLSLLIVPLVYRSLPESLAYLIGRGRIEEATTIAKKLDPSLLKLPIVAARNFSSPAKSGKSMLRVVQLMSDGRAKDTVLIWVAMAMCMFMVYGLSTWLPVLMRNSGYSLGSSLTFFITLNAGAIIGALVSGILADKWGGKATLTIFFVVALVSILALGYKQDALVLIGLLAIAGATTIGTLTIVHAFVAQYYPADIRSTGIGVGGAVGRFGAVAGPAVGGYLLSLNLPINQNFMVFALPGAIGALAVVLISSRRENKADCEGARESRLKPGA